MFNMSQFIFSNNLDLGNKTEQGKYQMWIGFFWLLSYVCVSHEISPWPFLSALYKNHLQVIDTINLKEIKLLERLLNASPKAHKRQRVSMPCLTNETIFNESPRLAAFAFSLHYPPCTSCRSYQFILNPNTMNAFQSIPPSLFLAIPQSERKEKPL